MGGTEFRYEVVVQKTRESKTKIKAFNHIALENGIKVNLEEYFGVPLCADTVTLFCMGKVMGTFLRSKNYAFVSQNIADV